MPYTSPGCGNINLDALHFTPDELRSLNELIVTAVLEAPALDKFHTLYTGIKNDKRIGIIPGTFGLIGLAAQGCDPDPHCIETVAVEKTWEPRYIEVIDDKCITDITDSLMRFYIDCQNPYDLTGTQIFAFVQDLLSKDLPKMVLRHAWFGDQAAANFPAGVLTPGVPAAYFNVINGFWQQLAVVYAANPLQLNALPGNASATYALQQTVATPLLMYNAINTLMDNAIAELAAAPDRILLVTRSVFDRLRRHLQALGTAFQDITLMTNGFEMAMWDGVPIYSIPLWDQWIRAYEDNGVAWNDPHRAVYTTKSNLAIGMACTSLFENFNIHYDPRSRYNRIEVTDAFDAKIIDDRLFMVGR